VSVVSTIIALRRNWLMLTDDRAARAEARLRQARFSGSIGCLVLAVERGLVPLAQANGWLEAMIAQGYYAPWTDLSLLINRGPAET
jgi:predicted nucleic acid-binding protein